MKRCLLNVIVSMVVVAVCLVLSPLYALAHTSHDVSPDKVTLRSSFRWGHISGMSYEKISMRKNQEELLAIYNKSWRNDSERREYKRSFQQEFIDPLLKLGYTDEKYALVFGSLDNDVYQSNTEASANMVNITIDVWQLGAAGEKYQAQRSLTVNRAIADRVQAVFKEIFEGPEQFPIYCAQGYAWRPENTSEHRWGLAIDINPNENYMVTNSGAIVAGSFWDPDKSPYSIPVEGDVVTAFNKYGFTWGGNAWRSANDYMHFSYLGR